MRVLFASSRPLERAENINTVFDAYNGNKFFTRLDPGRTSIDISSGFFDLLVSDEFPAESPGKVIMITHGIVGGKTYGLDQPHPYLKPEQALLLDYVVVASDEMIPLVARQCGISETKVMPLGMPRTDMYFGKTKGCGKTFMSKKRSYLYAPTFRGKLETPLPEIDWHYLDEMLSDDEVFVVKPHMITGHMLNGEYKHILEVFSSLPSTPYLIDCDVLITDYSSIMFDAHILNKPVVLFDKNTDYLQTRGMYFPYPDGYASRYCDNERDLIKIIKTAHGQNELDLKCKKRTCNACDGHSTERVISLIRSIS